MEWQHIQPPFGRRHPLSGRLTALADVYDAQSNASKPAFTHQQAKAIILEGEAIWSAAPSLLAVEDLFVEIAATS